MAHRTHRWLRPALLASFLCAMVGVAAFTLLGSESAPTGTASTTGTQSAANGGKAVRDELDRTAPGADLGCWGAPIGSQFRHHVDDRCDFEIESAEGGRHPGGKLHAVCDVTTTVLDRHAGETLVRQQLDGLQFLGADDRAITGDAIQQSFAAAAATPVSVRLDEHGKILGFGFAAELDGDQRNFLRGTLGLFGFEAPAAEAKAWTSQAADTTGEYEAHYEVLPPSAADEVVVRRTRVHYTAIAGQAQLPEHQLRGAAEAHFATELGWLRSARITEGMTLTLPLLDLHTISERTATITFVAACTVTATSDLASLWQGANAPASGLGETVGGFAAGNERRRWQDLLKGVTLDQLLGDLQSVLAAQPVDNDALDGVFQKLQWLIKLDESVAAQLAEQLTTRQLAVESARVVLGALGAAGTSAAQQVLAAVRADRSVEFAVREAATVACIQLAQPESGLVGDMAKDADSDSDLRGTSMLVLGVVGPRADTTLADGRSPVATLLAMEDKAVARGELSTWMLAVANSNAPETLSIAQRLLGSNDADVRGAACVALRSQPQAVALQALVERGLADTEPSVRIEAVLALSRRSEPAARSAIERIADQDPSDAVRERARRVLGRDA